MRPYEALMASAHPLAVAEAPIQRDHKAAEGEARVLSLDGHWRDGRVVRRGGWLAFTPEAFFEPGMSGSPIINMSGKAIGVASVNFRSPALVHHLPTGLLRSIRGARRHVEIPHEKAPPLRNTHVQIRLL